MVQLQREVNRYQQKDPRAAHSSRARSLVVSRSPPSRRGFGPRRLPEGPLFRRIDRWGNIWPDGLTGQSLTFIVQRAAEAAGLDPEKYSLQSFRPIDGK